MTLPVADITLDPAEVSNARTELALNAGPLRIGPDGPDWGDAEIQAYLAEAAVGDVPADFRLPTRIITIPLLVETDGATSFTTIRAQLQKKVARLQQEGGWLRRKQGAGTAYFADIVNASLKWSDTTGHLGVQDNVVLTLETVPDFYAAEVTLADHVETTAPELIFTETNIDGDYPGRVRVVVDNDDPADIMRGMLCAQRSRNYDSAATAKLAYASGLLTPMGLATSATGTWSLETGATVGLSQLIDGSWNPVFNTKIAASGLEMTHKGSYQVFVRAGTNNVDLQVQLLWDVGDLAFPNYNDPVTLPGSSINSFHPYLLNLGTVRLDPASVGTHRWKGMVRVKAPYGAASAVKFDRFYLVPIDEPHNVLRAARGRATPGLVAYSSYDDFVGGIGNLTGTSTSGTPGGTWTAATSTDTDDFTLVGPVNGANARRVAVSDATAGAGAVPVGRTLFAGATSYSDVAGSLLTKTSSVSISSGTLLQGIEHHGSNQSNWAFAGFQLTPTTTKFVVLHNIAGVLTTVFSQDVTLTAATYYYIEFAIFSSAYWRASWRLASDPDVDVPTGEGVAAGFMPTGVGATLASGRSGIMDAWTGAAAMTRDYDSFRLWVPDVDAVAYATRSAQLTTTDIVRQDSTGTAYANVYRPEGELPRISPSGLEARTVEFFIRLSRGDFDAIPDYGSPDDLSARVFYRPSFLFPPT